MERRPGRGTIRTGVITSVVRLCDRCNAELTAETLSVQGGGMVRCLPCWYSTWNEHGHPEGETRIDCAACWEGRRRPHTHDTELDGFRIRIIGCPGCIDEERTASATGERVGEQPDEPGGYLVYDDPVGPLTEDELEAYALTRAPAWQGYDLETWLERVDPGHDRPWIT